MVHVTKASGAFGANALANILAFTCAGYVVVFLIGGDGLEGHATVIDEDNPRRSEFRKHFALEGLFAFSLWLSNGSSLAQK